MTPLLLLVAVTAAEPSVDYTLKAAEGEWTIEVRLRDLPPGAVGHLESWGGAEGRNWKLDGLPVVTYLLRPTRDDDSRRPWCGEGYCGAFTANTLMHVSHGGRLLPARRTLRFELPHGWTAQTGWGAPVAGVVELDPRYENGVLAFGRAARTADYFGKGRIVQYGLEEDVTGKLSRLAGALFNRYATQLGKAPERPSVIFAFGSTAGTGTRTDHGIVLNLQRASWVDSPACAQFVGHELLHDWLGGLLRAVPDHEHVWFQEGFTDYLSARALQDAGLDDGGYLARKLTIADSYLRSTSERHSALSRVDWRANRERELAGYRYGALLAARLDIDLRARGGLSAMLSDLLRERDTVTSADVERWLGDNGYESVADRWLKTAELPPLDPLLRDLGVKKR